MDHVEHGADGNVEYHLDNWSKFGTRLVYRATTGQVGYHVEFAMPEQIAESIPQLELRVPTGEEEEDVAADSFDETASQ
jgi:hypothetical protein